MTTALAGHTSRAIDADFTSSTLSYRPELQTNRIYAMTRCQLHLTVDGQYTGIGDITEDVGTGTQSCMSKPAYIETMREVSRYPSLYNTLAH